MQGNEREDLFNLIPAYAIDALDDDERARFESWLQTTPEAQVILADYERMTQHMVTLTPLHTAPAHLKQDLRQRLASSAGENAGENVRATHTTDETLPHTPEQMRTAAHSGASVPKRSRQPARQHSRWATWLIAAAAVLVAVIAGVLLTQWDTADDSTPTPDDAAALYAVLDAEPDSQRYAVTPGDVSDSVSGELLVSDDGQQAVLRLTDLPAIDAEQTFQMWLVDDSGASSGGLFSPPDAQQTHYLRVPFEATADMYQAVGMSLEPAGGSPYPDRPTGPRVLLVRFDG